MSQSQGCSFLSIVKRVTVKFSLIFLWEFYSLNKIWVEIAEFHYNCPFEFYEENVAIKRIIVAILAIWWIMNADNTISMPIFNLSPHQEHKFHNWSVYLNCTCWKPVLQTGIWKAYPVEWPYFWHGITYLESLNTFLLHKLSIL